MTNTPVQERAAVLRCMEIWGSSQAVDTGVRTPGLKGWLFSQPYHEAASGGDVHYVSLCGGGLTTRLILADVSGHGTSAAATARTLRDLMRRHINRKNQTAMVCELNRAFTEAAAFARFATALVATYQTRSRRLTVCNAGHPRPFWYRSRTATWDHLTASAARVANLPLGIDADAPYEQFTIALEPGDILLAHTDGLTEARDPDGRMLGESGLLDLVRRAADAGREPELLARAVLTGVAAHRGNQPADDDVTLIVLRHDGGGRRRATFVEKLHVYAKVLGLEST